MYEDFKVVLQTDEVSEMKNYSQHGSISTYEHCKNVAVLSEKLDLFFHLNCDKEDLFLGAFLHDFYLYDWHKSSPNFFDVGLFKMHGFRHPIIAAQNAKKIFNVNNRVYNIISSHMWPLTFTHFPKYKEAWVVCIADKISTITETFRKK